MTTNDNHDHDRTQPIEPESASADTSLALIEEQADRSIRRLWHDDRWYFSVIDVIGVLTDSPNPGVYWRVLKLRLKEEGGDQTVTKCNRLKLTVADGKQRLTDAADTETLLHIIQSVLRPKPSRSSNGSPASAPNASMPSLVHSARLIRHRPTPPLPASPSHQRTLRRWLSSSITNS